MSAQRLLVARYGDEGGLDLIDPTLPTGSQVLASLPLANASFVIAGASGGVWHVLQGGDGEQGRIATVALAGDRLNLIGSASTGGAEPCHAAWIADRSTLAVANYTSGSVTLFTAGPGGSLGGARAIQTHGSGPDPERQEMSHPHFVAAGVGGHDAVVLDLGADTVWALDEVSGDVRVSAFAEREPGSGPRHLASQGGVMVITDELSGTVSTLDPASPTASTRAPATRLAGDGPAYPGDILPFGDGFAVAVRGRSSVSLVRFVDGDLVLGDEIVIEGSWPQQLIPLGGALGVVDRDGGRIVLMHGSTVTPLVEGLALPMWAVVVPER